MIISDSEYIKLMVKNFFTYQALRNILITRGNTNIFYKFTNKGELI